MKNFERLIGLSTAIFFIWFMHSVYPQDRGYSVSDRELMNGVFASAEYEARKDDIARGIEPLSVADLEVK